MTINAGRLLLVGGGGVFVWSGIAGKSVSSVFRQLAGGDSPTTATSANAIAGESPLASSAAVSTTGSAGYGTGAGATPSGSAPAGAAGTMLAFFESKVGHPYLAENPQRFGPTYYDCSGLCWAAANAAGIKFSQSLALAELEPPIFIAKGGTVIKSESQCVAGDICFFVGADPESSQWGPIGHVGMCSKPGQLVSAYDTAQGVCYTPMSQDQFVIAVRLPS
jgi:cell wall-associated NlpC family hydrolase